MVFTAVSLQAAIIGVKDAAFVGANAGAVSGDIYTDWSTRVTNNGGAMPSQTTILAMETLRTTLIAQSVTNKIYNMCVFVPDSVIASFTPLFYHKGWAFWTNTFVIGDLNVNGLKGNGSTKMADTGVKATVGEAVSASGSCGLTVIITEVARGTNFNIGNETVLGRADPDFSPETVLTPLHGSDLYFVPGNTSAGVVSYMFTNYMCPVGYISGNRDANSNLSLFVASPLEAHKLLMAKAVTGNEITLLQNTFTVFCRRHGNTNELSTFTTNRMSMAAIHDGFTQTESSNFWWAVKTCREQLGGGTGDPVHDWATHVVNVGGAAVSVTTSNALRGYWQGLDTDGLLYKIVAANCVAPDNLIAARTPLIWQGGHPVWQNTAFSVTNLSVNGLRSDATTGKYLLTGITNSVPARMNNNSGGISSMVTTNETGQIMGGTTGSGFTHFTHYNAAGTAGTSNGFAVLYCWGFSGAVGVNFLVGTNFWGGTSFNGYFTSGNRTAINAIALYVAAQTVPHYRLTNSTQTQTQSRYANQQMNAWGTMNNGASPVSQVGTISYLAVHGGFTQTESSNHYYRVHTMRIAMGGGSP